MTVTPEKIQELENRMLENRMSEADDLLPNSLEWLRERQPVLFEWITHHFQTPKNQNALLGVSLFAMILIEKDE